MCWCGFRIDTNLDMINMDDQRRQEIMDFITTKFPPPHYKLTFISKENCKVNYGRYFSHEKNEYITTSEYYIATGQGPSPTLSWLAKLRRESYEKFGGTIALTVTLKG